MPIVDCLHCGTLLSIPQGKYGAFRCPNCKKGVLVPEPVAPRATPPVLPVAQAAPVTPPAAASRNRRRLILGGLAGVLLPFCLCGGCGTLLFFGGPKDAAGFYADYAAHPKEFRSSYQGRRVTVSGRVVGSANSMGETAVELGASGGVVIVRFISPADAATAAASRGVTVNGIVDTDFGLIINSSNLLWSY